MNHRSIENFKIEEQQPKYRLVSESTPKILKISKNYNKFLIPPLIIRNNSFTKQSSKDIKNKEWCKNRKKLTSHKNHTTLLQFKQTNNRLFKLNLD